MVKSVKSMVDVELLVVYADAQLRNSGGTTFSRGFPTIEEWWEMVPPVVE